MVEQLASRALTDGKRKVHVRRDEEGRILESCGEGESEDQEQGGTDAAAESALLHFSAPRDTAAISAFLRTRFHRPQSWPGSTVHQPLLRSAPAEGGHGITSTPSPTRPRSRSASPRTHPGR
ncbi:hypothetical protein OQI_27030 [Streptomyces pharetrae CZA14]|uniref:Uncharacterized protein n=1 Tax=Streptomyces pharetrae CZA14 TaxID=1144883 RepID=A0ABX3YE39_9ACTN|nr:hypothetical protein OQI_27030 [Streptomyces pharetrae CZA14]